MHPPQLLFNATTGHYDCIGDWSIHTVNTITPPLPQAKTTTLTVDGRALTHFDSAGALVLLQLLSTLVASFKTTQAHQSSTTHKGSDLEAITWVHFNDHQTALLQLIHTHRATIEVVPPPPSTTPLIEKLGREATDKSKQVVGLVHLVGDLTDKIYRACRQWRRFQGPSIVSNIASTGLTAMPIVGLLSFLIGVVLAYQMGLQLETYGATSFIAYLSGMAVFREFGPLITAIIVAGRTSSAFTAQIGSMKLNEEIDALHTMGLSPTELLVLPKLLGLLIIFPLLVFWADLFGILGAMLMSKSMLNISYSAYLIRLQDAVGFKQLALGLYKAPAFAILIALVGCFQGFRVEANADSVGSQTTRSVVQALFLIIITDAIYSVIYSKLNL